jgi:hypothetical protein
MRLVQKTNHQKRNKKNEISILSNNVCILLGQILTTAAEGHKKRTYQPFFSLKGLPENSVILERK